MDAPASPPFRDDLPAPRSLSLPLVIFQCSRKSPLRALVADGSQNVTTRLAALLASWGHDARVVNDSPAALAVGVAFRPDMALVGLNLPPVVGTEVGRA